MNALFILAMIPDSVLEKVCTELHSIVDALRKRNVSDISEGGMRVVRIIVEAAEEKGLTPEKIMQLLTQYAPQIDLPMEFVEELLKRSKAGPSNAN